MNRQTDEQKKSEIQKKKQTDKFELHRKMQIKKQTANLELQREMQIKKQTDKWTDR